VGKSTAEGLSQNLADTLLQQQQEGQPQDIQLAEAVSVCHWDEGWRSDGRRMICCLHTMIPKYTNPQVSFRLNIITLYGVELWLQS
jgi:hypothetical protein